MRGIELETLRIELRELGATAQQQATFESDVPRARAAIAKSISIGADSPIGYAMTLFRSERFKPDAPAPRVQRANQQPTSDPMWTDDGERIWQWHEVDEEWRKAHLEDCLRCMEDGSDPAMRYQPSEAEFDEWWDVMHALSGSVDISPASMRATAERALEAWAVVWGLSDADPRKDDLVLGAQT